ncbi:MAG: 6-bladed beta-propeller [Gemmatimonadetes bacterium]|nr:6-bladed beta-propeller [Gemmatimonadota bacterium]
MRRWCGLSMLLALTAGAQTLRDSAGVRLRSYRLGHLPAATWRVSPAARVRIGGAEGTGPSELAGVVGAARLSDGRLVVVHGSTNELRIFDASGRFERTIGRRGMGPSEFEGSIRFARTADTLFVVDGPGRVQAFRPDGTLLRTMPRATMAGQSIVTWYGTLSDGASVVLGGTVPFDTTQRRPLAMFRVEVQRDAGSTLVAEVPGYEMVRVGGRNQPLFLSAAGRLAVRSDRACTGWTGTWEVSCWSPSGQLYWRTRREVPAEMVREADREMYREAFRRMNATAPRDRIDAVTASFQFGEERSRFGRLEMGPGNEVWISEFVLLEEMPLGRAGRQTPAQPVRWSVLGSDGRWVADIVLPRGFHLLEAGTDYVLGIERDADDVESVTMYAYQRR